MKRSKEIAVILFILHICLHGSLACPSMCSCVGTQVDCCGRSLIAIPSDIEETTTNLDLSDNAITSIGTSLTNLKQLVTLNLNNNSILMVDDSSFENLSEIATLDLGSNQISMLSSSAFLSFSELTNLNLADNQLEILPNGLFNKTFQLKILNLARNRLTDYSLRVINTVYLAFLDELNVSGNILPHIPYLAFNNLASLRTLFIIKSSTDSIDSNAFIGLRYLNILDLSLNRMTSFRREIFQSIPQISQLGIFGNPISCSCSIKQVQDFLRENTVTLLVATNCSLPDGSTRDIQLGDLTSFCPDPTTPSSGTVSPLCEENTTLSLTLLEVDKDTAEFQWDVQNGMLHSEASLHLYVRKATQEDEDEYDIEINTPPETPISVMLDEASPYVACIYQVDCKLRSCINFATDGYGESGPLSLGASVGVTSASFVVLIIILVVIFLIGWKKKSTESKSHYVPAVHQTAGPEKVHIYVNEDPYEDIPPDSPIAKMPKRRHANDALPQPGENFTSSLPNIHVVKKRPLTEGSHTLTTKKRHSPQKQDKPEHIAAGAQTKVFRRPNTMGSQELLADVPGLPPKSGILSKSQELQTVQGFPQPNSTVVSIDISENPTDRSSHVYVEPDN